MNDEKLKDPTDVANVFSNYLKTITRKLNIQQIQKGDAIATLKKFISYKLPQHKNNCNHRSWGKKIIHSLKPKTSSGYYEITS